MGTVMFLFCFLFLLFSKLTADGTVRYRNYLPSSVNVDDCGDVKATSFRLNVVLYGFLSLLREIPVGGLSSRNRVSLSGVLVSDGVFFFSRARILVKFVNSLSNRFGTVMGVTPTLVVAKTASMKSSVVSIFIGRLRLPVGFTLFRHP